jgi:hypothetical protein
MSWRPQPLGAPSGLPLNPIEQTAADLIGWLSVNGCTKNSIQQVVDFQNAWNDSGRAPLVVDGIYASLTRTALQSVMDAGMAPADCFQPLPQPAPHPPAVNPVAPPVAPTPPTPAPVVVVPAPPSSSSSVWPYVIGAGVATAGVFGYLYWKKNRRRS